MPGYILNRVGDIAVVCIQNIGREFRCGLYFKYSFWYRLRLSLNLYSKYSFNYSTSLRLEYRSALYAYLNLKYNFQIPLHI